MKKLSLSTTDGCKRLLALCLILILVFSCGARVIATQGASIKNERIKIDARGALLDGELYYPAGIDDQAQLPAVIVTHGAGCTHRVMNGISLELARRGFVVFAFSADGTGNSEFPKRDEIGAGEENYNARETPGGLVDALEFVRTLKFVDQTRVGMIGHSQGSRRTSYAASLDTGYYTLNDILINVLYDTFGQAFTAEEIGQSADELAKARLNADQLAFYEELKAQKTQQYNTRLKAALIVGGDAPQVSPMQTVTVGGIEVRRNAQVNLGLIIGDYDSYIKYPSYDTTLEAWHSATPVEAETWYGVDDVNGVSQQLGTITDTSVADNAQLLEAINAREARLVCFNAETHGRNFFSTATTADVVKYFEQTLCYNNGELLDASTKAIDAKQSVFVWRELLNGLAMLAMLAMLLPLAGLLIKTKFFAPCKQQEAAEEVAPFNGKLYWIFGGVMVVITFLAILITNRIFNPFLPSYAVLPIFFNWWVTFMYLGFMGLASIILLAVLYWLDKKNGRNGFAALRVKMPVKSVLKSILLAACLVTAAYVSLNVIEYLFNEDYRFWCTIFTDMKVEYWWLAFKFAVLIFIPVLLINMVTNYTLRKDIPEWKDTLLTVLFGTLGVWLCCGLNYLVLHAGGAAVCNWNSAYGMLLLVPATTYLSRKIYKVTGNVWLGALLNAFLIGWCTVSTNGYNSYVAQSLMSIFFHA